MVEHTHQTLQQMNHRLIVPLFLSAILAGCGGGGGGGDSLNSTPNATVAAQVADITPGNADDTVSVAILQIPFGLL